MDTLDLALESGLDRYLLCQLFCYHTNKSRVLYGVSFDVNLLLLTMYEEGARARLCMFYESLLIKVFTLPWGAILSRPHRGVPQI